jgi:hypothetical protein
MHNRWQGSTVRRARDRCGDLLDVTCHNGDRDRVTCFAISGAQYSRALPNDAVASDAATTQRYVIVMRGEFVNNDAVIPLGAELPHGNLLVISLDPTTQTVVSTALIDTNAAPTAFNVASLGPLSPTSQ